MIVTIGQPGLFPWWGSFAKFAAADAVVHLDHVSWQKGGYLNRFSLEAAGDRRWATIPLDGARLGAPISEIRTALPTTVLRPHLARLSALDEAPHVRDAAGLLEQVYSAATTDAAATAIASTDAASAYLGITTPTARSSSYPTDLSSTPMLLHLLQRLGATGYLFGAGRAGLANHYLDVALLKSAGLRVGVARYGPAPRVSILQRVAALGGDAMRGVGMEVEWL